MDEARLRFRRRGFEEEEEAFARTGMLFEVGA